MSRSNVPKVRAGFDPAAILQPEVNRALIRIELLRLAHRHDLDASKIVERATALEGYVFDDQAADKATF